MDRGGVHLHGRRVPTNPDLQSDSPRAFWGRTDSSGAQWQADPADGRGGTAPGAVPGIRAGSPALPVSGCSVRRAGGLVGGLRVNRARVRRKETEATSNRGDRYRRHGSRDRAGGRGSFGPESTLLHGLAAAAPPPRPLTRLLSSGAARLGKRGPGSLEASAAQAPSPIPAPSAPRWAVGPVLPSRGVEPGGHGSRSLPRCAPLPGGRAGRSRWSSFGFVSRPG